MKMGGTRKEAGIVNKEVGIFNSGDY